MLSACSGCNVTFTIAAKYTTHESSKTIGAFEKVIVIVGKYQPSHFLLQRVMSNSLITSHRQSLRNKICGIFKVLDSSWSSLVSPLLDAEATQPARLDKALTPCAGVFALSKKLCKGIFLRRWGLIISIPIFVNNNFDYRISYWSRKVIFQFFATRIAIRVLYLLYKYP